MTRRELMTLLKRGFGQRSVVVLGGAGLVYGAVALTCPFLIDTSAEWDPLLGIIWVTMTLAMLWDPKLRRDGKLIAVALVGGLVIEGWGTNTILWKYWTDERPPLWILPAWPIAAIAVDRFARLLRFLLPGISRLGPAYWVVLPCFVLFFCTLMRPAITHPWSLGVLALMAVVIVVGARPRRDIVIFIAGAASGIFLEYWGTSRHCWMYWNGQTPPLQAVLAHGFASVSFARGVQLLEVVVRRWQPSLSNMSGG